MKELTLKRLVALQLENRYIYEIEEDKIQGESYEDLEDGIRLIINTDKSLGIETICIITEPVARDIAVA